MSLSRTPPPAPPANRPAAIITISVLAAVLVLLGIALMWIAVQSGFGLPPTPTPTATTRPPSTSTPNVPATHVAEDMVTRVAFAATLIARLTPGAPGETVEPLPFPLTPAGTMSIQLPFVESPGDTPLAATEQTVANALTAVFMPNVSSSAPQTPAPVIPPTFAPPTPFAPPQLTPTPVFPVPTFPTPAFPTPVFPTPIPPSPTPPFFTPTPIPGAGIELNAVIRNEGVAGHVGPSDTYTQTAGIGGGFGVRLRGRTAPGDWVYACCLPNTTTTFWIRRAYVNIVSNTLVPNVMPDSSDPNDPKWLPVVGPDPALAVRPTPTSIPLGDFPLAHYDAQNSGFVPALPNPPLQNAWTVSNQAAQGFVSPVAVTGPNVLASSQDGQFYSLDITAGNQRWRYNLQNTTTWMPSIQDGLIYLTFGGRSILALQDQGNQAGVIWQSDLPANATSPFNIWLDTLFIGAGEGGEARVMAVKRGNPADRREFAEPNARVQQPAIGQETLYVGADRLWAIDINLWLGQEIVWTSPDVFNIVAAPVYSTPGVVKLAELYVADGGGVVHAVDANTGQQFWTHAYGGEITGLAVNQTSLFIVGNNILRAVSRQNGQQIWTQVISGRAAGAPLVTNGRVMVVTQTGGVFILDSNSGAIIDAATNVSGGVPGAPAVSASTLFAPSNNATIYAYRGTQ